MGHKTFAAGAIAAILLTGSAYGMDLAVKGADQDVSMGIVTAT